LSWCCLRFLCYSCKFCCSWNLLSPQKIFCLFGDPEEHILQPSLWNMFPLIIRLVT
jgi:hypothetical protein